MQIVAVARGLALSGKSSREYSDSAPGIVDFTHYYAVHSVSPVWLGARLTEAVASAGGLAGSLPLALLALSILVIVGAARWGRTDIAWVPALAGAASVVFAALVFSLQWEWLSAVPVGKLDSGDRYSVVPSAVLGVALLVAADALGERGARRFGARTVAIVAIAAVIAVGVSDFRLWNVRSGAESWKDSVGAARQACVAGTLTDVVLPKMPTFMEPFVVPCAAVTGRR